MTLGDYQMENGWGELDAETQRNVMATYIIDLESEVERLQRRMKQLDEDISLVDGGY